jgi:hypothetical protein
MKKAILLAVISFIFLSEKCEPTQPPSKFDQTTFVEMKKGACFGRCPVYTIKIDGTGAASYHGDRFVDKVGDHKKQFTPEQTNALMQAFVTGDFWSFRDEYTADISDLPYTFLTFSHQGKTKKITLYYDIPDQLAGLAQLVASFAATDGWIPVGQE